MRSRNRKDWVEGLLNSDSNSKTASHYPMGILRSQTVFSERLSAGRSGPGISNSATISPSDMNFPGRGMTVRQDSCLVQQSLKELGADTAPKYTLINSGHKAFPEEKSRWPMSMSPNSSPLQLAAVSLQGF